jgi:hypothetical protein
MINGTNFNRERAKIVVGGGDGKPRHAVDHFKLRWKDVKKIGKSGRIILRLQTLSGGDSIK